MLALLKLIPLKDWLYGAAIVAILISFFAYSSHERQLGAAREKTAVENASKAVEAKAEAQIAVLTTQHTIEIAHVKENYDAQLKTANDQSASDAGRLREYDAYRRAHPALPNTQAGPGAASGLPQSSSGYDASFDRLEQVALEFAAAGREMNAALSACIADRDSLVGK